MVQAQFRAFCPFEIGDELRDTSGKVHTITDIACVHYVRTGKVEFRFELDRSGQYAPIEIQDAPPEVRVRLVRVKSRPPVNDGHTGTCLCCRRKWGAVEPHVTKHQKKHGVFPLCEECWGKMSPEDQLPFYEALILQWEVIDGCKITAAEREAIKTAVLAGK